MADVLGAFEQAVLLSVLRLRDDAYGLAILKEVQARLERDSAASGAQSRRTPPSHEASARDDVAHRGAGIRHGCPTRGVSRTPRQGLRLRSQPDRGPAWQRVTSGVR